MSLRHLGLAALWIGLAVRASWALESSSGATITSDELELRNNGELTIFTGDVVLTQAAYQIRSDRMIRPKSTGIVDATGHVIGTWISPKKEKVRVTGDQARYNPTSETIDVWGPQRVGVQLEGEKGSAAFVGDRGWASTHQPGKARLTGNVLGHIIPASVR